RAAIEELDARAAGKLARLARKLPRGQDIPALRPDRLERAAQFTDRQYPDLVLAPVLALNEETLARLDEREIRRTVRSTVPESRHLKSPAAECLADQPLEIAWGQRGDRARIEARLGDG